jgi:hypothetical protein
MYERLFIEQMSYGIGIRRIDQNEPLPFERKNKDKIVYDFLKPKAFEWYADPFPVEVAGKNFVFFEYMDSFKRKGTIGVVEWKQGEGFGKVRKVLEEPFHMSFPNVFMHGGKWYMLPEPVEAEQLRLYEAESFPYKWKLNRILVSDIKIVDTTITRIDEHTLLLIGNWAKQIPNVWILDMDSFELQRVDWISPKLSRMRCGGNSITNHNAKYRVLQSTKKGYGTSCMFYQIDVIDLLDKEYEEHFIGELTIEDITYKGDCGKASRVHTFNRFGHLETVDFYFKRFNPFKMIYKVVAHYKYGKY